VLGGWGVCFGAGVGMSWFVFIALALGCGGCSGGGLGDSVVRVVGWGWVVIRMVGVAMAVGGGRIRW